MFGEKAPLLLFLCLYITPLVNWTGAGEWFGVLRAAVEADNRLLSTAHHLQRVSHMQPALRSFRASIFRRLCPRIASIHELGASLPEFCAAAKAELVEQEPRTLE